MTPTPLTPLKRGSTGVGSRPRLSQPSSSSSRTTSCCGARWPPFSQSEGYRVECAANALDALRRLERPPKPSLILLDIMLPYMDGLEFRALQRATPELADIPVIVITAVGIRPEVAAELDLRQAFFKPLERPRLLEAIRRHCRANAGLTRLPT